MGKVSECGKGIVGLKDSTQYLTGRWEAYRSASVCLLERKRWITKVVIKTVECKKYLQ